MYYSISIFVSSWIVLAWAEEKFRFTYYGIISAACWVPASILSIFAINHLGMSVAVGVWAGITIVVSFIWGATYHFAGQPEPTVKSPRFTFPGLALLVLGVVLLSLSGTQFVARLGRKKDEVDEQSSLVGEKPKAINGYTKIGDSSDSYPDSLVEKEEPLKQNRMLGLICAVVLGVMNGSMLVPMKGAPQDIHVTFVISFAIGVVAITPVAGLLYFGVRRQIPVWHWKVALLPGLATGLIWNIGNVCSIYATQYLGLSLGFPLTQLALVVSGLWGMIVYREMTATPSILWWIFSLLVVGGGVALMILGA